MTYVVGSGSVSITDATERSAQEVDEKNEVFYSENETIVTDPEYSEDEIEVTDNKQSTYIGDVNRVGENFYFCEDEISGLYDNRFNRYLWWCIGEYDEKQERAERFATNKAFQKFKGVLFVGKSDSHIENSFRLKIYSDDEEVWESPIISIESDPLEFDVDIKNAKILTLEFEQIEGTSGVSTFFQKATDVYLANGELY